MNEEMTPRDMERRAFLKRAGVVAGATVWATPTIQSLAAPAFAAGSPPTGGSCPDAQLVRFQYNVGGAFESGTPPQTNPAGACLAQVDGYYSAGRGVDTNGTFTDGTCTVRVTVAISPDGKTATVTVVGGTLVDADIKGGSSASSNGYCADGAANAAGTTAVITAPAGGAGISFVGGVVCPAC